VYAVAADQAGAVHVPPVGDGLLVAVGDGLAVGDGEPVQAPSSDQTAALPGVSPCVHHFALHVRPPCDTRAPPE
jgi:hypothetical protein